MAHYAFLDKNNIVTEVITGVNENELIEGKTPELWYSEFRNQICKRTSYNTRGGSHIYGKTPYRKNYAGIGYKYDKNLDAFIPPKPFDSWILNEETCLWVSPKPLPNDGNNYIWIEEKQKWELLETD